MLDKALLLTARLPEGEHEIPGVGVVRFRALTRGEALQIVGVELPYDEMERRLLSMALVDPVLTTEEVRAWQQASPAGELEPICEAIQKLSGLEEAAAKGAYQRFRG